MMTQVILFLKELGGPKEVSTSNVNQTYWKKSRRQLFEKKLTRVSPSRLRLVSLRGGSSPIYKAYSSVIY